MKNIYQTTLKALKKYNAQPEDLLRQAEEVYQMSLIDGYKTEKVAGKEYVQLIERIPGVAVQALNTKLAIIKFCEEQLVKQGASDETVSAINIKVHHG